MKVVKIQGIAKATKFIGFNLVLPALLLFATATEGWARYNIFGNVHARGIVPSPNGAPYWVEYDASGTALLGWVQEALPGSEYAIENTRVLSVDEYKGYIARYQQLQQDHADHPNASEMLILRDGSPSTITLRNTVTGVRKTLDFTEDALRFTKTIVIAPPDEVVGDTYIYNYVSPMLLATMPVDPTDQPTHDKGALLLGEGGVILKESPFTIGFSTAFYIDEGGRTQSEDQHRNVNKHWLVNPLADVDVDVMFSTDETSSAGDYHVYQPFMLCSIAASSSGTHVSTSLSYQAFNPNNNTGIYPYFLMKLVPWRCQNLEFWLAPGPAAFFGFGMWYLSPPSYVPRYWYDVDVDFSVINGRANLVNYIDNPDGGVGIGDLILAAADTTYGLQNSDGDLDNTIAPQIKALIKDFDGDGAQDVTLQGRIELDAATGEKTFNTDPGIPEAERVLGVYLSSIGEPDGRLPDIYRRMDTLPLLQHQGLVTGISEEDLKNTDVYFFRKSTGELMAERTGSTLAYDKEKGGVTHHGVAVDEGNFYYTLHLRGSEANRYRAWSYNYSGGRDVETNEFIGTHHAFAGWQQDSGVNPEFQQRNSNFLRPGEWIQIIAINRATGYIGTRDFLLWNPGELSEDNGSAYKSMSRMVDDIEMHPPNLKVWAERKSVKAMGAQADIQDYVIGNEGAALQSDTIQIYTEWLNNDGSPLPSALGDYGYTGRVAHVSDDNFTISNLGQSANLFNGFDQTFSIKPGRHTEVINVSRMTSGNDHIYVQVSGEPHSRSFSFQRDIYKPDELSPEDKFKQDRSSEGAHEGIIAHRPILFVPFKVKVWNEIATEAVQLKYKQQKEANPDFAGQPPEPVYHWLYRPEFQYSVYDLTVEAIEREYNGTTANIYNPESDRTPVISSSDDLLQVLYTLEGSEFQALEGFSFIGDKHDQLTFAIGDNEVQATVNQGSQSIEFDNLDALAALDVEDFLSLRLYANNDASNVLWEWAFEFLALDTQLAEYNAASGETLYISADDPVVPLQAAVIGFSGRDQALKDAEPAILKWQKSGSGNFESPAIESDDDLGVFFNEIRLPPVTGATAQVSATLANSDSQPAMLPPIEVVPGVPAYNTSSVGVSNHVHIAKVDTATVTVQLRDKNNNTVAPGTGVSFLVDGGLELVSSDGATGANGVATAVISGSDYVGPASVTVRSGDVVLEAAVDVRPLNVAMNVNSQLDPGQSSELSVSVTDSSGASISGVAVELGATFGFVSESVVITDANGEATLRFTAPPGEGAGSLTAQVGLQAVEAQSVSVAYSGPSDFSAQHAAVIGDQNSAGAITHTRYDNETIEVDYPTTFEMLAKGVEGQQVPITLGDAFDINAPIVAAYYFNSAYGNEVADETGLSTLYHENVTAAAGTRLGAGTSFRLINNNDISTKLWGDGIAALNKTNDLAFSIELLRTATVTAPIVDLGQGAMQLKQAGSMIEASVRTSAGGATVELPMPLDEWAQVAVHFTQGELTLYVNDQQVSTAVTGGLDFNWTGHTGSTRQSATASHDLVIGDNFNGFINSLKWYHLDAAPVLTFTGGTTSTVATIGADGTAPVMLQSAGNMHIAGSQLPLQRVAVSSPLIKEYASVLSTEAFASMAGLYLDALAPPGDVPPDNLAGLQNPPQGTAWAQQSALQFSLFPKAHAGLGDFLWGAVNFILPIESLGIVIEQLGYLSGIKEGEFDAVAFSLALVDVATLFPPAAPLKAVVKPLQAMLKVSKRVNPKFAKFFGVAIIRALRKAKKGDFDSLWNMLPFMVLAAELYADEEAREGLMFLMSTVDSGDDLLSWVDYLALPADGWEGSEIPSVDAFASVEPVQLPLGFLFEEAHAQGGAARRVSAAVLGSALKTVAKTVTKGEAKNLPDALGVIRRQLNDVNFADIRKYAKSPTLMKTGAWMMTVGAARSLRGFIKGKSNARYSMPVILATLGYLGWESACGTLIDQRNDEVANPPQAPDFEPSDPASLECAKGSAGETGLNAQVRAQVVKKLLAVFGDAAINPDLTEENPNQQLQRLGGGGHGALFHLVQTAYFQAEHRFAGGLPVKFLEKQRWVAIQDDDGIELGGAGLDAACKKSGTGCFVKRQRYVDIILGEGDVNLVSGKYQQTAWSEPETWVELKSYSAADETGDGRYQFAYTRSPKHGPLVPWEIKGTKGKQNWSTHLQFSLDRAAEVLEGGWLPKSETGRDRVDTTQAVGEIQWRFQAFKTYKPGTKVLREISPKLGSTGVKGSFKALVHSRPAVKTSDSAKRQAVWDNSFESDSFNFENKAKLVGLSDLAGLLVQAGFKEITDGEDLAEQLELDE